MMVVDWLWRRHELRDGFGHVELRTVWLSRREENGNVDRCVGDIRGHGGFLKGEGALGATDVREQSAQEDQPLVLEVEVAMSHHPRGERGAADRIPEVLFVVFQ
jgi:hypothetical protein